MKDVGHANARRNEAEVIDVESQLPASARRTPQWGVPPSAMITHVMVESRGIDFAIAAFQVLGGALLQGMRSERHRASWILIIHVLLIVTLLFTLLYYICEAIHLFQVSGGGGGRTRLLYILIVVWTLYLALILASIFLLH